MICNAIQKLIEYALAKALITTGDVMVVRNALMNVLGVDIQSGFSQYIWVEGRMK